MTSVSRYSLKDSVLSLVIRPSLLLPATKLGQGNIFRSVCQEFYPGGKGHVWQGAVHDGGACVVGGGHAWQGQHAWWGACMAGGHVWQEGMHGRRHAWQGHA